ncbi:MAG: hypothetical protein AAF490_27285 [Chloroflexota bacterium]
MDIALADERALVLKETLTMDQAEGRAWSKKVDAFGRMAKVGSFLQKPKDSDFELIYKEHRLEPFWHIICRARYVYERYKDFEIQLSGDMVENVTINGVKHAATNGRLTLKGTEHCREEPFTDVFIDAYTNEKTESLRDFLGYAANEVQKEYLEDLTQKGIIIVPPQVKASSAVRDVLVGMMQQITADRIIEDSLEVEKVDLYYRPVYAFQYRWHTKEKEATLEYDGLTGNLQTGGQTFQQYVGKVMDTDFLFDVGVDTIDLFVPGGGLAIKLARKGMDMAQKSNK